MREIKFRAWDKIKGEMFRVLRLDLQGANGEQRNVFLSEGQTRHTGEFVLMQYTGLKDKKGVEIYEGDIVEHSVHCVDHPIVKIISFWEGSFVAVPISKVALSDMSLVNFAPVRTMEVIGNIHENIDY